MEERIIETSEQVTENVVEEIAKTAGLGKGCKVCAGVGAAALVCGLAYKYIIKPRLKKAEVVVDVDDVEEDDSVDEDIESEE